MAAEEEIRHRASTDDLTGLLNRREILQHVVLRGDDVWSWNDPVAEDATEAVRVRGRAGGCASRM